MLTLGELKGWLFEYSLKQGFHDVVWELLSRERHFPPGVPHISMVLATVAHIVIHWKVEKFELAINLINYVYSYMKCVPFKIFAKLVTGLKMKMLLCQLLDGRSDVLDKLYRCFPRNGPKFPNEDQREVKRLRRVHSHFRKLYLTLILHERQRIHYFRGEYEEEYGENWAKAVKILLKKFLETVLQQLPVTTIEKILREGPDNYISEERSVTTEMFLEVIHGKSSLESSDLMEVLTMWNPAHSQDRVQTQHQLIFTNQTDSYSDDGINASPSLLGSSYSSRNKNNHLPDCRTTLKLTTVGNQCKTDSRQKPYLTQNKQTACSALKYASVKQRSSGNDCIKAIPLKRKHNDCYNDSCGTENKKCQTESLNKKLCQSPKVNCSNMTKSKMRSLPPVEERLCVTAENKDSTQPVEDTPEEICIHIVSSDSGSSQKVCQNPSSDDARDQSLSAIQASERRKASPSPQTPVEINSLPDFDGSDLEIWQDEGDALNRSISDIDALTSDQDDRILSSSKDQSGEIPALFVNLDTFQKMPNIKSHIKKPFINLCVVNLFHQKDLDQGSHRIFS